MTQDVPLSRSMGFTYGEARELRPGVRRIVANNPGPFTFKGTNTYLIGTDQVAVIDPGPDDRTHLEAVLTALEGARVSHIILTHTHRDHCDGLAALQKETGAETWGFAGPDEVPVQGPWATSESEYTDTSFRPDHPLTDGDAIMGDGWALTAIHTPGHAPDHLCFALQDDGGPKTLFSGDHVMGWSTSVVAPPEGNMGDYMASLERMLDNDSDIFLPGHGGAIRTPRRVVKAFIMHRKMREAGILDCIRSGTNDLDSIVARTYPSLDDALIPAAKLSVLAHLELLVIRGDVVSSEAALKSSVFSIA